MEKEWLFKVGVGLAVFLVIFMAGFYSASLTGSFFHQGLSPSSSSSLSLKPSQSAWYGTGNCGKGFKCSSDGTQCVSGSQKKDCVTGYFCGTSAGGATCFKKKDTSSACAMDNECNSGKCDSNKCT